MALAPFQLLKTTKIPGSKHFTWHEALWLDSVQGYAVPTLEQETNIVKTAAILDGIREFFGRPITVTSWLRPKLYNSKIVGGAIFSAHMNGSAVDFIVQGLNSDYVRAELKKRPDITSNMSFETDVTWVHVTNDNRGLFFGRPPRKLS